MWLNFLFLGLGGALGAMARHLAGVGMLHITGWQGHWATFWINVSGCFVMGFLATYVGLYANWGIHLRYLFFTGFLGSYTTFSTYMLENFLLMEKGDWVHGLLNMAGSVLVGFTALWAGISLAKP